MNKFIFKEFTVEYVVKSQLKHTYIKIISRNKEDITVLISTPIDSLAYIKKVLLEKEKWIEKKILSLQNKKYLDIKEENKILLFGEYILYNKTNHENYYKKVAKEYLTTRIEKYAKIMSLEYKELKFRKMKSRWGSCSSHKRITLNRELVKINKELIDYVIVHELAHLVHMNHSKAFHSLVNSYLPNSLSLRKELKNIYL